MYKLASIACAAALLAAPMTARAGEPHSVLLVWIGWAESARPPLGDALAVRIWPKHHRDAASCEAAVAKANRRQKVRMSWGGVHRSLKVQGVCYRRSATHPADVRLEICGKGGEVAVRACQFLKQYNPHLRVLERGEAVRLQR